MKYYPIKDHFYPFFKDRESVLSNLIENHSIQKEVIVPKINQFDFFFCCTQFYNQEDYRLKDGIIYYTHPVTKEVNTCTIFNDYLLLTNLLGFEMFLKRYFRYYYCMDAKENQNHWFHY